SAIETLNKFQTRHQSGASGAETDKIKEMEKCGITLTDLDELSVIHVTGTHGKGSTCAYTENILRNHGYKTGFYSSPHLLEVRERIKIDGKPISKSDFAENFWKLYDMLDGQKENENDMPLYFPLLTVLAFYIFLKAKVDVAIVEVGIGGEYDRTNVIRKTIAVGITPINVDHTALLGSSVSSIAWHKAGIMKKGASAFTVQQSDEILGVLTERSKERECPLSVVATNFSMDDGLSKIPQHVRRTNASLAVALSEEFVKRKRDNTIEPFSLALALRSITNTHWPGRYQIKQEKGIRWFLDSAHTVESVKTCAAWFRDETKTSAKKKGLIFNLTGSRDGAVFLKELLTCDFYLAIFIPNVGYKETPDSTNFKLTPDNQLQRCEEYKRTWIELQQQVGGTPKESVVFSSFAEALAFLNDEEYDVLITGSLYLVGAALSVLDPTLDGTLSE
ncbi:hypothetical protein NQ318_001870, partial [Aromia moschata]